MVYNCSESCSGNNFWSMFCLHHCNSKMYENGNQRTISLTKINYNLELNLEGTKPSNNMDLLNEKNVLVFYCCSKTWWPRQEERVLSRNILWRRTNSLGTCSFRGWEYMSIMAGSMAGGRNGAGELPERLYLDPGARG